MGDSTYARRDAIACVDDDGFGPQSDTYRARRNSLRRRGSGTADVLDAFMFPLGFGHATPPLPDKRRGRSETGNFTASADRPTERTKGRRRIHKIYHGTTAASRADDRGPAPRQGRLSVNVTDRRRGIDRNGAN